MVTLTRGEGETKICLISKQFYPATIGGAELYIYEIYKRIRKENEVTILTYDDVDYEEAEVIHLPEIHFAIRSLLFSIIAGLKARLGNYDVVHINGYWGEFSGLFVKAAIVTVHDVGFLGRKGILNKIRFFLLDKAMRSARKVIIVSERSKKEILRGFKIDEGKIRVIPAGIDPEKYITSAPPGDGKVILSFGRFARNKGYEYLIDAFKIVNERIEDAHLVIAGYAEDKSYITELEDRAEAMKNVQILQNPSEEDKIQLFATCDIYCQPSIADEGFGITILEAMASSKPCIATDIFSGVGHLPEEFLVKAGDKDELASRIIEILNSDYRTIGAEMRRRAEKYSWDNIVRETLSLYREVGALR